MPSCSFVAVPSYDLRHTEGNRTQCNTSTMCVRVQDIVQKDTQTYTYNVWLGGDSAVLA